MLARDTTDHSVSPLERVILVAVERELQVSSLVERRDVCVENVSAKTVDEKQLPLALKRSGVRVHPGKWCYLHNRGIEVDVLSLTEDQVSGLYRVDIEVVDERIPPGVHFATLLKRGTYVIRCLKGSEPQILSYEQMCCTKS